MPTLFEKLNLKDIKDIAILNLPSSLEADLVPPPGVVLHRDLGTLSNYPFVLAFVTQISQVEDLSVEIRERTRGDAVVWLAYPKGTSKRYTCEFNRDTGWASLGGAGFEPVRMIAVDEDWSALRFRRVEFIQVLTRKTTMALSEEGKKRGRSSS